jgi:hypothetical protein
VDGGVCGVVVIVVVEVGCERACEYHAAGLMTALVATIYSTLVSIGYALKVCTQHLSCQLHWTIDLAKYKAVYKKAWQSC